MKSSLQVGTRGQFARQVGPGQTITLGDDDRATVFSTPSMISLMEYAAREALRPHLEQGEESVGVDVQITHSAATPPKSQVTAEANITAIEKNVISFEVVAHDAWGEIGRGTHRRAVIDASRFAERLAKQKPSPPDSISSKAAAVALRVGQKSTDLPALSAIERNQTNSLLRITLNRPKKRNAISAEMTAELEQIITWLAQNESSVRVVIVSGAEATFCAGDDVGDLPDSPEASRQLSLRRGATYQRITELPQIFIAAIDGLAVGGGCVFAASCDFRIATYRAKLGLPEVSLGWPPNYGMGIVQSLIGRSRAIELALSGQLIDARRAESIGLLNRVVSPIQLESEASRLADQLVALPPQALSAAKRLLGPGARWSDEVAADAFVDCLSTEPARKSIQRFRK